MALTERIEEDSIEIKGEFRQMQVRTAVVIERDGVEISRMFHREVLNPDDDVNGRSELIRGLAGAAWTPEIKEKWNKRPRPNPDIPSPPRPPGPPTG